MMTTTMTMIWADPRDFMHIPVFNVSGVYKCSCASLLLAEISRIQGCAVIFDV